MQTNKETKTIKLSSKQKEVIRLLREYPNDIIMHNYWMTGGHGICFDGRSVESLISKGIIAKWGKKQLTELGKTINID